jgi:hypothetical protein
MNSLLNRIERLDEWLRPSSPEFWMNILQFANDVVLRQLCPIIFCYRFEADIRRRIRNAEEVAGLPPGWEIYMAATLKEIRKSHSVELKRREGLQSKAQAILTTATLASAFGLGVVGLLASSTSQLRMPYQVYPLLLFATLGVLSLSMSAICAVRGSGVGQLYDFYLAERASTVTYNQPTKRDNLKAQTIKMILLNEGWSLVVANFAHAAGASMRNGVICIALAIVWAIFSGTIGG